MQMGRCCMCDPPTILLGRIYRFVYPSFPADYAAISTASWSSGTTGHVSQNFNCRYVTLSTPDRRTTSAEIITDPVRFSVYGPATDGGTFDYWIAGTITGSTHLRTYQFVGGPVTDGMLPLGSHAEWNGGELSLAVSTGQLPIPAEALQPESNLYAGSSGISSTLTIHAFAHRVNGSIVGSVQITPFSAADFICPIADGDSYEVDVWYKVTFTASSSLPATSGYVNRWLSTTSVSNGSRRLTTVGRPAYFLTLENANFAPNFNWMTQSYQISISGHTGWTLLYGANGPIPIQTYAGFWFGNVGERFASMTATGGPVYSMTLAWDREVAIVVVVLPALDINAPRRQYLYRSTTASAEYRSSTTSTDLGPVDHAHYGFFNQAGTTVFEYVEWNTGFVYGFQSVGIPDGVYSNAATPPKPPELPQTITYTRIPRPTTGSTTYDSGSGFFEVPPMKTILQIKEWGGGGGGGSGGAGGGDNGASGGGGGSYLLKTVSVSPGDLIAYAVGAGGAGGVDAGTPTGTAGGTTTVTVNGVTYSAGGGPGGLDGEQDNTSATAGGTASGGDTNTSGGASTPPVGDDGGAGGSAAGSGGSGGAGGVQSVSAAQGGTAPGGGGGGGAQTAQSGAAGANGRVTFTY